MTVFAGDFNAKSFKIEVNQMQPMAYPMQSVNDFSIEVKNDSINMYLPYMGELHTAPTDNDGLNFKEHISQFKVEKGKKDKTIVTFNVRHNIVEYRFRITVFPNNTADINLDRSDGQPCSYYGSWE